MHDLRSVFVGSVRSFVAVVGEIPEDRWSAPGLGEWDVRSLVGHTLRGVTTAAQYLLDPDDERGRQPPDLTDAGAYLAVARSTPGLHESVAERGRAAGGALDDPVRTVTDAAETSIATVLGAPEDAMVATPFGTMHLDAYLPTRVVEVVVHTDDLCRALGRDPVAGDEEVAVVLRTLGGTAGGDRGRAAMRALLGRAPLPDGFNLWG